MHELEGANNNEDPNIAKERAHLESVNRLTEWKSTQLNIGIMGPSGLQRQNFIKTLTGDIYTANQLAKNEPDYEFITHVEPVGHAHASNKNVIFWEMPECLYIDKTEYIDLMQLMSYDLLLICQCDSKSYDENDLWLAETVKSKGIPVFFIKYHFEGKVADTKQTVIDAIDRLEFQIIEKINDEFKEINAEPHENHYVVSSDKEAEKHDFTKLIIDLAYSLDNLKSESLILTVEPFSADIIHKKYDILKAKTYHSAMISTLCGVFTHIIPGIGIVADLTFLVHEVKFFLKQFGLDEEGLNNTAKRNKINKSELMLIISRSMYASLIVLKDLHSLTSVLMKVLPIFATATAMDSVKFFPIVGHIIHGSISFLMTKYTLIKILDEFSTVALDIDTLVEESRASRENKEDTQLESIKKSPSNCSVKNTETKKNV